MSLPTAAHDQVMALTQAEKAVLNQVDDVMEKVRLSGNPRLGLQHAYALRRGGHLTGLALAKLLYHLSLDWASYQTDIDFEDAVLQDVGVAPETTRKYTRLWQNIFDNPEVEQKVKELLFGKPIGALLLVSAAAKEGDLTEEDWDGIVAAHDKSAVHDIVRARRGSVTSSERGIFIFMERDGTLRFRRGSKGRYKDCGRLIVGSDDEDVDAAVQSIISARRIKER